MRSILFIIGIGLFQSVATSANTGDVSIVRVRLLSQQNQLEIEGEGITFNGKEEFIKSVSVPTVSKWNLRYKKVQGRILWQVSKTYPTTQNLFFNTQKPLVISGQNLKSGNKYWQGNLSLVKSTRSSFDVIAQIPLRSYLIGVLKGEMPKDWPLESLKAQAIAARSYVDSVRRERKNFPFDVDADHRDQVYSSGLPKGFGEATTLQERAVFETKNIILAQNEKPLKAYFHSDCGGEPASAASVWGQEQKNSRTPAMCFSQRRSDWSFKLSKAELFKKIKNIFPEFDEKHFRGFQWVRPRRQHRVSDVKIAMSGGKHFQLRSQEFREALGYGNLKSTLFEVQKVGSEYVFTGKGFGHGVGLCQHGAQAMAQSGKTYQQILNHYYPQAQLAYRVQEAAPVGERGLSSTEL